MSAFLGPIHFWLYRKITLQQEIVEDIIALGEQKKGSILLREVLDSKYGVTEVGKLDEIIDVSNIHGWLQERISKIEYKLAYAVTSLVDCDPEMLKDIEEIFYQKGKENYTLQADASIDDIYKELTNCLLDGMPCDRAYMILEQDEKEIVLKRNLCVHKTYWDEVGKDIKTYYILRNAFIKGFLSETDVIYETIDETTHKMIRGSSNE